MKLRMMLLIVAAVVWAPGALAQKVEQLWARNCAVCHGAAGEGAGPIAKSLLTEEWRDARLDREFFDVIKKGKPGTAMTAFGALSDEQAWGLVVHLRELQARDYREKGGGPKPKDGAFESAHHRFKVEDVIGRGLDTPWSVDFLPTGEMLVTERPGRLRVYQDGKLSAPVKGTPKVRNIGQGGMMDVAPHPGYRENGWIFLAFSDIGTKDTNAGYTKIVRGKITPNADGAWTWGDQLTIFEADQDHYSGGDIHFGCRIVFDPKDPSILYFGLGERGQGERAQDLRRPNGKIHRVTVDGKIPADNPFAGMSGVCQSAWSYGHRNPQGLVFDLAGNLWDTEHGPRGGDELNLIRKGRNFGWPLVCFGINYSDEPFRTPWREEKSGTPESEQIAMPALRWLPSIAACGLDVVRPGPKGEAFPKWKGDLVAGGLAGRTLQRVRVEAGSDGSTKVVEQEELVYGLGRVRDVVTGPDGSVYLVLNEPDKVIRLVPAGK